jgi:MFS family permease
MHYSSNTTPVHSIRVAVFCYFFCQGLIFASWASRIPTIKEQLHLTDGALGYLLLMLPLGQLCTLPLSGKLVTRYGSALICKIAAILYALILCSIPFAIDKWTLGISLFAFGIAGNLSNIAVNTQAVGVEALYTKSIMSSFHGGWSIAGFVGALIGLITLNLGLNTTPHFLIILTLVILNSILNIKYLLPNDQVIPSQTKKKRYRPDLYLIQLGIIGFFSMATEGAMFDWSGVYFKDIVKVKPSLVILGYASFMVMMAAGRFAGDYILQRLGRKKVFIVSGILMCSGMLLSVLLPYILPSTIGFMLVGLGVSCCVPTVYSFAGKHPRIPAGIALALVTSISFLGFLLGPPLIGFIAEFSNLKWSFSLFSLFGIAMVIIVNQSPLFQNKN